MNNPRVKWTVVILGILVIISYTLYQARYVIGGPSLTIESPKDGEIFSEPLITLSGHAENTTHILVNGRTIFTAENGNFSDVLLLHSGHTIIEVQAEDRFGKKYVVRREVTLITKGSPPPLSAATSTDTHAPDINTANN